MEYINGFAKEDFLEYMYNQFPAIYNNTHSRELLENIVDYCTTDNFTHTKNELIYTLEKLIPKITGKELLEFADKSILTSSIFDYYDDSYSFEYQLLDRLKTDCNYYLGNGNRCEKHLWAGNVKDQIAKMKELYEILPVKPEWLSLDDIEEYETKMTAIHSLEDLQTAIENHGWNITAYNDSYWDISQFSPAGEDFFFTINHNNSVKKAIEEISQYANDFDIDEHIEMWADARQIDNNRLKVPPIRILVEDAEAIQEMLDNLAMYCNTLDFSSNCQ